MSTNIHIYIHHTLWNWLLITVRKGIFSLTQIGLNHNREKWNIGISIFINYIYVLIGGKLLLQCYVCFCHTTTRISHDFILLYISLPSIFPPLTHPTPRSWQNARLGSLCYFFSIYFPDNIVGHPGLELCSTESALSYFGFENPSKCDKNRHLYVAFRYNCF